MKRWTLIFKALANINRLKIIALLFRGQQLNVSEISKRIGISLKATSKHLIIMGNLDILEGKGHHGHIFYSMNQNMPKDIKRAISLMF